MSNTFSQIYIQIIFAVKNKTSLINPHWEEELYKYLSGSVQKRGQKMLAIDGVPNHIHFFFEMKPDCILSDFVREIKKSSNDWIKTKRFNCHPFQWQKGYGAFSYSLSEIDSVIKYIHNQKEFHQQISFKDEYISFLKDFEIDYKEEYLFDWIDG